MSTGPILSTSRLFLRPWRDEDLAPFAAINADPRVVEYFPSEGSGVTGRRWLWPRGRPCVMVNDPSFNHSVNDTHGPGDRDPSADPLLRRHPRGERRRPGRRDRHLL